MTQHPAALTETAAPSEPPLLRLHSVALARVTGQPFESLEAFASPATREACRRLEEREDEAARRQAGLERALHAAVGQADPDAREALLKAARNLRRNHKLSAGQDEALVQRGGAAVVDALRRWREAQAAAGEAERALETVYAEEHTAARRGLRRLVQDPAFQRGLLQSSTALFEAFRESLRTPFKRLPYNRKQRRLELGLLRYLSRSAAKTSPFSTLTALAPAHLAELPPESLVRLPAAGGDRAAVTLNKVLYALVSRVIQRTPALFPCFAVTLNPTLHARDGQFVMLLPRAGREQIVKLPMSAALSRCIERIEAAGGTLPYDACAAELAAILGAAPDAAAARLNKMIAIGLLALNTGISDQEHDWAPGLARRLSGAPDPLGAELGGILADLEEVRASYGEADAEARALLLERSRRCVERLDTFLEDEPESEPARQEGAAASDFEAGVRAQQLGAVRRNLFYEDVGLPGPVLLSRERLGKPLEALAAWIDAMSGLTLKWGHQATMREHYARLYGDAPRVAFPRFYETFFAEVFDRVIQQERGTLPISFEEAVNPYGLPVFAQATAASDALCVTFCRRWAAAPDAENLTLTRADVAAAAAPELFRLRPPGPRSAVVFAQAVPRSPGLDRDCLLVDRQLVQSGMGRYHSRFLHQFDAVLTAELRRRNERAGTLVAEVCDDSEFSFNANLHPRLTELDINYPSRITGLSPRTNLSLAELDVEPSAECPHLLRLVHRPTGKEVLPVDLGFLALQLRPPLFRVLLLFSPLFQYQMTLPWRIPGLPEGAGAPEVQYRPRVLFEERLILARRAWRVQAAHLRDVAGSGTPARKLFRLDRWRRANGLPGDLFFVKTDAGPPAASRPGAKPSTANSDAAANPAHPADSNAAALAGAIPHGLRRHAAKPQYVRFPSALLVDLLLDEIEDHGGSIVFEEMLPTPEMLARRGDSRHALELVLQLDGESRGAQES